MTKIPQNIEKKDILKVLKEIDLQTIPPKNLSKSHDLIHDDKSYPPKYVLSKANESVNNAELKINANQAYKYLEKLGFCIITKEPIKDGCIGTIIEGNDLNPKKKEWLSKRLKNNCKLLHKVGLLNINNPPILVKFMESNEFEKIWAKQNKPNDFFNLFESIIIDYLEQVPYEERQIIKELISSLSLGEPIVAFVSDIDFKELIKLHPTKTLESPGIYIKKKDDDDANLDFGMLYCLIKAQIYYSISRKAILKNYSGIDSFLYSVMALKVMTDSEYSNLVNHQKFNRLGGNWAIPIVLAGTNKKLIDMMIDNNLIKSLIFGEHIDERRWIEEIINKVLK